MDRARLLGLLLLAFGSGLLDGRAALAQERPYQGHLLVTAQPRSGADVGAIWEMAEEVLEPHDPAPGPHRLVITAETLRKLRARQIPVRVERRDVQSWIDGLSASAQAGVPFQAGKLNIFGDFFTKVQSLEAIYAHLDQLAAASGGRAQVVVLGKSFEGRDIKAMRISSAPAPSPRASIVVVGAQHAREWAAPVVTMGLIEGLIKQVDVDPRVKRVVDTLQIYINPVNNPDGYVATFNGRRLQRKNMNSECNVDLNRNYGTAWGAMTAGGGCNSGTYPGKAAFSEPESQAVKRLIESLDRPALFYDYHSTAAQVMIPFAYTTNLPPNYAKNRAWCELYSSALRGVNGTSYPARAGFNLGRGQGGGAFDWFRTEFAETMVVELGGGFGFSISDAQLVPFAEENYVAWLAVAEKVADENPAAGGPDGGAPPTPPDAAPAPPDAAPTPTDAGSGTVTSPPPPAPPATPVPPAPVGQPPAPAPVAPGNGLGPSPVPGTPVAQPTEDEPLGCQCALDGPAPRSAPLPIAAAALLALLLVRRRLRAPVP